MALFDEGAPKSLEDVLGRGAETAEMGIENAYAQKRRRTIGQQAHAGRLGSGVSNYQFGDLDASEIGDIGNVESGLAESLGKVPAEDYESGQQDLRMQELAALIGSLKKKSGLMDVLGGIGAGGGLGAQLGGPWGAVAGGVAGGVLGGAN